MDIFIRRELDIGRDNVDVVVNLNLEVVDCNGSLILELSTYIFNVVFPVVNFNLIVNFELDFEFVCQLGESKSKIVSSSFDSEIEINLKDGNHLFKFNDKVIFNSRVFGKDFFFSSLVNEDYFFSVLFNFYLELHINIVAYSFIL